MRARLHRPTLSGLLIVGAALAGLFAPVVASAAGNAGWQFAKPYQVPHLDGAVNGLACPTVKECIAVSSNEVFWTTDATAGKKTWHHVALEPSTQPDVQGSVILNDVSCGSAHFCVAADDIGQVFVTSNPTGGKSAWIAHYADEIELLSIGCAADGTCAGIDYYGHLLSTANPASSAWRTSATSLTDDPEIWGVSCAGKSLCAAVSGSAKIATTSDPGAAAPVWHASHVAGAWADVSCPSSHKCIAVGGYLAAHGKVAVSTSPAHGSWKTAKLSHSGPNQIDCASASDCFADNDYATTHAAAKTSAWTYLTTPGLGSQTAVSCPSATRCFVGTSTDQFEVARR